MQKSKLNLVTRLRELLLNYPELVTAFEKKDPRAADKLLNWVKQAESVMGTYQISEVSELAGLRSKIINTQYSQERRSSSRKLQTRTAASVLYDIQHTVLSALQPYEIHAEECREVIRQLLQLICQNGKVLYHKDVPFEQFVLQIWQLIKTNEQLRPGAAKLKAILPEPDIHVLLAEEINLQDFMQDIKAADKT